MASQATCIKQAAKISSKNMDSGSLYPVDYEQNHGFDKNMQWLCITLQKTNKKYYRFSKTGLMYPFEICVYKRNLKNRSFSVFCMYVTALQK